MKNKWKIQNRLHKKKSNNNNNNCQRLKDKAKYLRIKKLICKIKIRKSKSNLTINYLLQMLYKILIQAKNKKSAPHRKSVGG